MAAADAAAIFLLFDAQLALGSQLVFEFFQVVEIPVIKEDLARDAEVLCADGRPHVAGDVDVVEDLAHITVISFFQLIFIAFEVHHSRFALLSFCFLWFASKFEGNKLHQVYPKQYLSTRPFWKFFRNYGFYMG